MDGVITNVSGALIVKSGPTSDEPALIFKLPDIELAPEKVKSLSTTLPLNVFVPPEITVPEVALIRLPEEAAPNELLPSETVKRPPETARELSNVLVPPESVTFPVSAVTAPTNVLIPPAAAIVPEALVPVVKVPENVFVPLEIVAPFVNDRS